MTLSGVVTVGLATFAVPFLFRYVDGPFAIFNSLRQLIGTEGFFAKLFGCFWCLGFWIGCIMLLIYTVLPQFVYVFAVLGIIGFMHEEIAS